MAKQTIVLMQDDLDGSEGARTVSFGFQGKDYQIDLTEEHEAELREILTPYIDKGRPAPRRTRTTSGKSRASSQRAERASIRTWAEEQGMDVPRRGRLPRAVIEAYERAHG